ncbi:hypothetical protein P7K49_031277 [Saguinus oedipus]|uniref:Uncharacterized protein n=1 Tax=Saguinus oedipus TaxID=9490 RepID=A0ABQ9TZM4_SAGOE|nr:hypothetical protein P7K49_031277 [Saguinus oedipus]
MAHDSLNLRGSRILPPNRPSWLTTASTSEVQGSYPPTAHHGSRQPQPPRFKDPTPQPPIMAHDSLNLRGSRILPPNVPSWLTTASTSEVQGSYPPTSHHGSRQPQPPRFKDPTPQPPMMAHDSLNLRGSRILPPNRPSWLTTASTSEVQGSYPPTSHHGSRQPQPPRFKDPTPQPPMMAHDSLNLRGSRILPPNRPSWLTTASTSEVQGSYPPTSHHGSRQPQPPRFKDPTPQPPIMAHDSLNL